MIPLGTLIYIFTMLPFTVIGMLIVSMKIGEFVSGVSDKKKKHRSRREDNNGWDREL